ncbi:hypothetical protein BU26DRAFT_183530 [Trematosphaeria pertusa]|uniref:Knr4/Smi1-like domain-containing protein n=1 Tax=Trematosphaeria pertusa TaxID=390896 RepID=A0A6A6HU00_9PLEO|nr:uncharacterized protein BU26DRAFT_183530 [Trematosphaeria pertusa]KAF2241228.1 hypothetical protein BU26DRAFT_183530 [Trematosphaeria pertusa]
MSHRMGRKFDRHQILRQKDPWEVARNVFDVALEFALLGYVDKATELYNLFENFASGCKTSWSPGLYFAWEATGLWPDSIPAEERTPAFLSKMETERILWKRDMHKSDEGLDKLIAIAAGEGKLDSWGDTQVRADDLAAAIDLALYMNKREKALDILQIIADNFNVTWLELSRSRQRLEKGAARIYKDLPMKELVKMCNDNTIKNAVWEEMDVEDPDDPPETILHKGATAEQIKKCEERLEHDLPDDFKEFLSLTNGIDTFWNGFYGEPKMLSTEEIHYFDASEQQAIWEEAAVEIGFFTGMSVPAKYPRMNPVIQINGGGEDSKFVWFMTPELGRALGGAFFEAFGQLPPDEHEHVKKLLGHFHAGLKDVTQIEWQVILWSVQTLSLVTYHSFREYLEVLAGDTANEDILDEEDEQGRLLHSHDIFAYQLR